MLILIVAGALVLALFFRSIRAKERAGNGFCRVDIHRVLVQSNLLRVIEPETTHRPHNPHIPVETVYLRYPKGRLAVLAVVQQRSQVWRRRSRMPKLSGYGSSGRRPPSVAGELETSYL